jgi:uncharacterized membrane protein
MSYYNVLLFAHIAAAVVWIGGGVGLVTLASRFFHARDTAALKGLLDQATWFSTRVFIPASLAVLVLGILLVIEGPWSFDQLWIVLGLVGFATTFVTGLLILKPRGDAISAIMERDGGMSPEAAARTRELFLLTRIDYAVLFMVVADMALKPSADDAWTLVAMAAVIAIVAALVVRAVRAPVTLPAE